MKFSGYEDPHGLTLEARDKYRCCRVPIESTYRARHPMIGTLNICALLSHCKLRIGLVVIMVLVYPVHCVTLIDNILLHVEEMRG